MIRSTVVQSVVEDLHGALALAAVVRDPCNIDAGKRAALVFRIGHANVVDNIVIGLHRALAGINRGKINSVAAIAVNQIVMDVEIKLIAASFVAAATAWPAQRRRMKLNRATGQVVVNIVPANINMVGVSAEIDRK